MNFGMRILDRLPATLSLLLFAAFAAMAQEGADSPRVGLVLSGGGAKGICHIGVLKVLEEEGIRPDLITGTSMGSLVGGLYACGYSANDIEGIVSAIHWDEMLTNKVGLHHIAFEEKRYYGRWIAELPYDKGLRLPSGMIRGQKIMELLQYHTLPFHGTSDFNDLPIPFLCIATDVSTGEAVVQDHGYLPEAMRASMSIPTFFSPLLRDSLLLVDGGEVRNFPVSDARERGCDLVIGVDVGDGLLAAEELMNPLDVLTQSAMFGSLRDTERQRGLCDVLILPDYAPYSTASFEADAVGYLVRKGYEAADALRPQLRALAEQAGMGAPLQPIGVHLPDSLRVDRVEVVGATGKANALAASRFRLAGDRISVDDLEERVDLLYGSRHFDLVQFRIDTGTGDSVLVVDAVPSAPGRVGVSLNYDVYHEVSIGVLFLLHDRLFPASRLGVEGYLGRYPSLDANYLKYIGRGRKVAAELEGYLEQGPAFVRDTEGRAQAEFKQTVQGGFLRFRSTNSRAFSVGFQLEPRVVVQRPKVVGIVNLGTEEVPIEFDLSNIDRIRGSWVRGGLFAQVNTKDAYVYPQRGWEVLVGASSYQNAVSQVLFTEEYLSTLDQAVQDALREAGDDISEYDSYLRATIEWSGRVGFHSRGALMFDGVGSISDEAELVNTDQMILGGFRRPDRTSVAFWGLNEFDGGVTELALLRGGVQWRFGKNIFWQVAYNAAWTGFSKDDRSLILGERFVQGAGSTLGMRGVFGLIQVGVATNATNEQVIGWFNFGFRL